MPFIDRAYNRVTSVLPASLAARADLARPSLRDPWGGPMNGQAGRRAITLDLIEAVRPVRVFETGTFRGTTTQFLATAAAVPVHTVEAVPRNFLYAKRRLADTPGIELSCGDSRTFLAGKAASATDEPTLFYLDAHWAQDLPLEGELDIIASAWPRAVVIIDDFAVVGDDGYDYDDYGPDRVLDASLLDRTDASEWPRYYPVLSSAEEDGARRGCVVLAAPAIADVVDTIGSLRRER